MSPRLTAFVQWSRSATETANGIWGYLPGTPAVLVSVIHAVPPFQNPEGNDCKGETCLAEGLGRGI